MTQDNKNSMEAVGPAATEVINAFFRYIKKTDPTIMSIYVAASALAEVSKFFIEKRLDLNADEFSASIRYLDGLSKTLSDMHLQANVPAN